MYAHKRVKTAWYCGLDMIPKDKTGILEYLDFCKVGHYDMELGGLDSPITNQRLYQYNKYFSDCSPLGKCWRDITHLLQKNYGWIFYRILTTYCAFGFGLILLLVE